MDEGDPRLSTEEQRDGAQGAPVEPSASSSRDSLAGAGWRCKEPGVGPSGGPPFSWINPLPMWRSRNQILGQIFGDPTNDERRLWMKMQREARALPENLILDQHAGLEEVSFLVLGDPGEGDASQYAVVKPLLVCGDGTDFMVVLSDVIYPSGDAEDYDAKFYDPYEDYP